MFRPKVVVIAGPTASGKSALAVEVSGYFGGEIISADSMQIYKYMDIGTAKPSSETRRLVRHHLIDILYPDEESSAALFREEAQGVIANLNERGRKAMVVGGTGLYIKALISGLIRGGEVDHAIRERLQSQAHREGRQRLYLRLREVDPITADSLHPHDTYRIIRALEVYERTGRPISDLRRRHRFTEDPYRVLKIGLTLERKALYNCIDRRVDAMMEQGLKEEVQRLLEMGYGPSLKTMQSLGYKQMVEHLRGGYDISDAIRRIKRDTRRYAKRQITWFKADSQIHWAEYPRQKDVVVKRIKEFWQN